MKNKSFISQLILFIIFVLSIFSSKIFAQKPVVGYMPTYRNFPGAINTADLNILTHVDIAFVNPDWNGNITMPGGTATVVSVAHAKNVKVLASICGGGGDGNTYRNILSNGTLTNTFVANLVQMCINNNLDGIDVDIEGDVLNGTYVTAAQYESFILKLRDALHAQNKLMTSALAGWFINNVTNAAAQAFDFIGLMSYDAYGGWTGPGQHSPYSMAVNDFNAFRNKGVPAEKLLIGLPFYGYGWGTNQRAWTFNEITTTYPGSENNDQVGSGANVIYYNGIPTIKQKCDFAKATAGGVMIWELTQDASGNKSLLKAVGEVMGGANANIVPDNLAKGKTITASSTETANPASNATDGLYNTRWSSLYTNSEWFYVNLGDSYKVNQVKITWETASAKAYQVQFSADGITWTTVKTIANNATLVNDHTGLTGATKFVRILCTDRNTVYGYSVYELEVYGTALPKPYSGTAISIPGIFQAENYDLGGDAVAFNDLTPTNTHGAYRTDAVDIEACTDAGGGYNVGGTQAGEWLNYSVNVTATGNYQFNFRVAAVSAGKTFHIEVEGVNVSGAISVPNTGGWQTWQTISTAPIALTSGYKNLRIVFDSELINLNSVEVVAPVITSVDELESVNFNVYPNPASDILNYTLPSEFLGSSKVSLISAVGDEIYNKTINSLSGSIPLSNLNAGVYILEVSNFNGVVTKRVLVSPLK